MIHDDDAFYENLSSLVGKHAPVRKMTRKEVKIYAKPWINQKIIKLIKYRDKLKWKIKRKPTVDNEHLYKKVQNQIANKIKASRSAYHNRYFQTHKDNIKKLWSGIRSIINIKQKVNFQVFQLTVNGIEVTAPPPPPRKLHLNSIDIWLMFQNR